MNHFYELNELALPSPVFEWQGSKNKNTANIQTLLGPPAYRTFSFYCCWFYVRPYFTINYPHTA